jgi:hypothetical protein
MCRLFKIALVVGLSVIPSDAQRAMSSGHSGGFSVSRGFASAPHMSGGFNGGGFASGIRSGPVGTLAPRPFNASSTYRGNTLIPSGSASRPGMPYGNWRGSPSQNWRHTYGGPYRRPYAPYFYPNSTYLVPGLLNSYLGYPGDLGANDGTPYFDQQPNQDNNNYQPNPAPDYGSGYQGQGPGYPVYQSKVVPPPPPTPSEPSTRAALTLIFKDGHSQQIHNYAMTGTKLYVLDDVASGRTLEIALNTLDLQATEETNRQAGVAFSIPVSVKGPAKN